MTENMEEMHLEGATEESKNLLLYLLRWIDANAKEVVAEKNEFLAYCKDEERGDMLIEISCHQVKSKDDLAKNSQP